VLGWKDTTLTINPLMQFLTGFKMRNEFFRRLDFVA
jgi:hypothetical protein